MTSLTKANPSTKVRGNLFAVVAAVLLGGACLGISAYSPQAGHSGHEFEGTWKAVQDGKVFIVLRFHLEAGAYLSGTIQPAGFQLQGTGIVKITSEHLAPPMDLPNINVDGKSLYFDVVESRGNHEKWRMDLIDKNKASLLWLNLPARLKLQPIVLVKEANTDAKMK